MQYLRARYYDQATGRFLSQDAAPSLDRYPYVGNQPVNFIDPAGNCRIEVRLKKVGGGGFSRWNLHAGYAWWHAYIVMSDEIDGSEKVYRGGPSKNGGFSGSITKKLGLDNESDDGGKLRLPAG